MLNERARQFNKAFYWMQGDKKVEDISPNGLKNIDGLALKQNMYRQILVFDVLKL